MTDQAKWCSNSEAYWLRGIVPPPNKRAPVTLKHPPFFLAVKEHLASVYRDPPSTDR